MYKARNIKPDIPPKAQGIFNKFLNFFKSMGTAMRSSGYKNLQIYLMILKLERLAQEKEIRLELSES